MATPLPRLLLALACFCGAHVLATGETTSNGCTCVSSCARTVDLPTETWCETSVVNPPQLNGSSYCGAYMPSRAVYWDVCTPNATSSDGHVLLRTFSSVWAAITIPACATAALVFCAVGFIASCNSSPRQTLLLLPLAVGAIGTCHVFLVSAIFSAFIAYFYFSVPYLIDLASATTLGVSLALLLLYLSLGRQYDKARPAHPSQFTE